VTLEALVQHRPGEVRRVASAANEAVKAIRALDLRKRRDESGLFVAEGARTLIEAQETGATIAVLAHLAAAAGEPPVVRLRKAVIAAGGLVLEVDASSLAKLSRRDNPQAVIGVVEQRWTPLERLRVERRALVLEEVRDPGNLGAVLRTADALGADAVVLVGPCTDPYGLEAVRASMGSIFAVKLARTDLAGFLAWRAGCGALVVGAHLEGRVDLRDVAWRDPSLIVMGNEQQGLSEPMANACDVLARIAMTGRADSLNLAVATAIAIYESVRGRR
jgi:TrmH family RNA methyltransferase